MTPSPTPDPPPTSDEPPALAADFAALGLDPELLRALADLGYEEPTPVQARAIPPLLAGRDLVGQAATGTGKTAAFALPLLQHLADDESPADRRPPRALVLAPTRELAVQVATATERYGAGLGVVVLTVYGGAPIGPQLRSLARGVDVVVATPGRAVDLLQRRSLDLSAVRTLVLDEADEMLDMGFAEDLEAILSATPASRQTVLFSATLPPRIDRIARRHLTDPVRLSIERDAPAPGAAPAITQRAHVVARAWKPAALRRVLDVEAPTAALVFCRSRSEVDELTEVLAAAGLRAEALHGGLSQDARDRVMGRLRAGTAQLLVATDVAARGLDVDQLTHVVNYEVPASPDSYVHRIGRVGRGGREGVAITLVEPREQRALAAVERATGMDVPVLPLPTLEDLRARRDQRMAERLAVALGAGAPPAAPGVEGAGAEGADAGATVHALGGAPGVRLLDRWEAVASVLAAGGAAPLRVAAAAMALLDAASGGGEEVEIPAAASRVSRPARTSPGGSRGEGRRPGHAEGAAPGAGRAPGRRPRGSDRLADGTTRLWVGLGTAAGVRPQDLVGAIANESGLGGGDIGAISVKERFSLVEVPATAADDVVDALRGSLIRGRKAAVRRDAGAPDDGEGERGAGRARPVRGGPSRPVSARR